MLVAGDRLQQRTRRILYVTPTKTNANGYPGHLWVGGKQQGELFCRDGTPPCSCIVEGKARRVGPDGGQTLRWEKKATEKGPAGAQWALPADAVTWTRVHLYAHASGYRLDRAGTFAASGVPGGDSAHEAITVTNSWEPEEFNRRKRDSNYFHQKSDLVTYKDAPRVQRVAPPARPQRRPGEPPEEAAVRAAQARLRTHAALPHRAGLHDAVFEDDPVGGMVLDPSYERPAVRAPGGEDSAPPEAPSS